MHIYICMYVYVYMYINLINAHTYIHIYMYSHSQTVDIDAQHFTDDHTFSIHWIFCYWYNIQIKRLLCITQYQNSDHKLFSGF